MALTSADQIITDTGLPADIKTRLASYIGPAEKQMRRLITDAVYDDYSARPADDPDRVRAVQCESFLTCFYAFPFLNLRPTTKGGFVKATGFDQNRNELMSKYELDRYRHEYYKRALALIEDEIDNALGDEPVEIPGAGFSFSAVEDEDE